MQITVEALVAAPPAQVWHVYTRPEHIIHWNAASEDWHTPRAEVDLRVGGSFSSRMEAKDGSMGFDFSGVYTQIEPERLLAYQFGDRHATVRFDARDGATRVSVAFDPESTFSLEQQQQGWQAILHRFAQYVSELSKT